MFGKLLGTVLDATAFNNSHNPNKVLGVFWYNITTQVLDIVADPNVSHNHRDKFKCLKNLKNHNSLIAGRVYAHRKHTYLMIYNTDSRGNNLFLPERVIQDLVWKAEAFTKKQVDFVVDGYGKAILESKQ